uniref:Uncharacterized protein n=1 Tax=Arundo donax TaxID=35708 RepID=A0A0A9FNS7_ARUDO
MPISLSYTVSFCVERLIV